MKILLQVITVDCDLETEIKYAIVKINDEIKQYLAQRLALFNIAKQFADDISDIRFWGCSFITFHKNIDLSALLDEDEEHVFDEQGYWEVPDDFANDEEAADCELERVSLDSDGWNVSANENYGVEVTTRDVPFALFGLQ